MTGVLFCPVGTLCSLVQAQTPVSRSLTEQGSAAGRGPRDLFLAEHGDSSAGQSLRVKRRGVSGPVQPGAGLGKTQWDSSTSRARSLRVPGRSRSSVLVAAMRVVPSAQ